MIYAQQGFQNIVANEGLGISLTGISIVFVALILISLFITSLPRVLLMLESVLPPESEHHGAAAPVVKVANREEATEIAVAIGYALHARQRKKD